MVDLGGFQNPCIDMKWGGPCYIGREIKDPALYDAMDYATDSINQAINQSLQRQGITDAVATYSDDKSWNEAAKFKHNSSDGMGVQCEFNQREYGSHWTEPKATGTQLQQLFDDIKTAIDNAIPRMEALINANAHLRRDPNNPANCKTASEEYQKARAKAISEVRAQLQASGHMQKSHVVAVESKRDNTGPVLPN